MEARKPVFGKSNSVEDMQHVRLMALPPETYPLRGFARDGQTGWRRTALYDTRRARARWELLRRVLTLWLWRK